MFACNIVVLSVYVQPSAARILWCRICCSRNMLLMLSRPTDTNIHYYEISYICMYLRASRCWIYIALNVHLLRIVLMYARVCMYVCFCCAGWVRVAAAKIFFFWNIIFAIYTYMHIYKYLHINNTNLMLQKLCENEWDLFGFDVTSYTYT